MHAPDICRIRYFPSVAYSRRHHLVYSSELSLDIYDEGGSERQHRHLVVLSLTEALIYLSTNPHATLQINETVRIPHDDAENDATAAYASTDLTFTMTSEGHLKAGHYTINPGHYATSPGVDSDFSTVPSGDPGGRWSIRAEDVVYPGP